MSEAQLARDVYALENGLTVIHARTSAAPVVAIQFWVEVGSGDESAEEAGLAHVLEHMLFKGTERRGVGEVAAAIERLGGRINAWTSFDQTVYHVVLPSRHFEEGLEVLDDAVFESVLDADELERELEVIQEEIRRGEDQPNRVLSRQIFDTAFRVHPYGRPVIGTPESVASFSRDDVAAFYERWYQPENITLVVVGDVPRERLDAAVAGRVARRGQTGAEPPPRVARLPEPPQEEIRAVVGFRGIEQNLASLAFRAPELGHEDIPALELLTLLLGQGSSSILYEELRRRRRLVNSAYSYLYSPAEPGLLIVGAAFRGEDGATSPIEVVEALAREVAHLRYRKLSADDLDRAVRLLESDSVYQYQTVEGIARRLGYFHVVAQDIAFERHFIERARRVTREQLRDVARRYLTPDRLTAGLLLSTRHEEAIDVADVRGAVEAAFAEVAAEHALDELETDEHGIITHRFDSGLQVIVEPDDTAELFSVRSVVLGGQLAEDATSAGVSHLVASLLLSGTESMTASDIARRSDELALGLSGFSGRNSIGMKMTALSRDFGAAMELFADTWLGSTFPDDEIERIRQQTLDAIASQADRPQARAFRLFFEALYGEHPYARSGLGEADIVRRLDRDTIETFYRRWVRPERTVVSVVGDVDPREVLDTIAALFETGGGATEELPARPEPPDHDAPVETGELHEREQAHIVLGYPTVDLDSPDRWPLKVLAAILSGQGGRLFLELRDRQSLAYSVFATSTTNYDGGYFALYIATGPDKVVDALDGLRSEVARLRAEGVGDEEVARARRYLIGSRDVGLQRTGTRASHYAFDELYGRGYAEGFAYDERLGAVTAEDVQRVANRYLLDDGEVVSIVRPPGSGRPDGEDDELRQEPASDDIADAGD